MYFPFHTTSHFCRFHLFSLPFILQTTLGRMPSVEKPKDPDADRVDRDGDARYDSDTMRSTNTDTLRSNSSSGSRKIVRHRVWDRVLTSNDFVNGKSLYRSLHILDTHIYATGRNTYWDINFAISL